jgi:hypothetical protein
MAASSLFVFSPFLVLLVNLTLWAILWGMPESSALETRLAQQQRTNHLVSLIANVVCCINRLIFACILADLAKGSSLGLGILQVG